MSIKIDIDPADDEDGLAALFIINDEEDYAIIKKVGESKELKNGYKIKLLALDQHYLTFELNCDGCGYGDKCYHFGDRKDGRYCSDTKQFLNQLEEDLDCENNFECSSNLCIDNSCISLGFLRKILSWFKNLFG